MTMTINNLKKKIHQKEVQIGARKKLIHQNYQHLKNNIHDKITSPEALLTAFSLGFLITYTSSDQKFKLSQLTEHLLTARNLYLLLA